MHLEFSEVQYTSQGKQINRPEIHVRIEYTFSNSFTAMNTIFQDKLKKKP